MYSLTCHRSFRCGLRYLVTVMGMALVMTVAHGQSSVKKSGPTSPKLPDWSGVWGSPPATRNVASLPPTAPISYTPEYKLKYEAQVKGERGEGPAYDPTTNCEPPGIPRLLPMPYPIEFIVEPKRVMILYEYFGQVRRIYTDGRKHPPADEIDLTYNGYSVGHWEGDTLVVDTRGFKDTTLIDRNNVHSEALQITERYRRTDSKTMRVDVTLTDAKAFTKPWSISYTWVHQPDWEIKEYVCVENNRNKSDETGASGFQLKSQEK